MSYTPKHNNPYYDAAGEKHRRVRRGLVALGVTLLAGGLVAGAVAVGVTQLARQPQVSASPSPSLTSQRPGDSAGTNAKSPTATPDSSVSPSNQATRPSDSPTPQASAAAQMQGCDGTALTSPAAGRLSSQELRATFEKSAETRGPLFPLPGLIRSVPRLKPPGLGKPGWRGRRQRFRFLWRFPRLGRRGLWLAPCRRLCASRITLPPKRCGSPWAQVMPLGPRPSPKFYVRLGITRRQSRLCGCVPGSQFSGKLLGLPRPKWGS